MSFTLRPYQIEAVEAVEARWAAGQLKTAGLAATGAGKTVMFATLIQRNAAELRRKGQRALVLAHRGELLDQAADKIREQCPDLRVGIVKGSRDESRMADVVVASVQTLAKPVRRERISGVGMVIVDECHRAASPTYLEVLAHYGCLDGPTRTLGVTATLTRMDKGISKVWDDVAFDISIQKLIDEGFLVRPYGLSIQVPKMNLARTRVTAGDLNMKDVADAMRESDAFSVVAAAYLEHASDRAGVVFTPDVSTATATADAFGAVGIKAEVVAGTTAYGARQEIYARYRDGVTQVLVNAMLLTEGWDAPHTSCVVMARPTLNAGLYIQCVGRGLRLSPQTGKEDCLILDVSGASQRHRIATVNDLDHVEDDSKRKREKDPAELDTLAEPGERPEVEEEYLTRDALRLTEIDLFSGFRKRTGVNWLQTAQGIWFVPAGDNAYVFVLPSLTDAGAYLYGSVLGSEFTRQDAGAMDLDAARRAAEVFRNGWMDQRGVTDYNGNRSARWRKDKASARQLELVQKWRMQVPENPTKGQVSDAQTVLFASRILDRRFGPHMAKANDLVAAAK